MSDIARTASEAVERLKHSDSTLKGIDLWGEYCTDLVELVDCLLSYPNIVIYIKLTHCRLTNEIGIKLARYVTISSTIQYLNLCYNWFGDATYKAIAAALKFNTSLSDLYMYYNKGNNNGNNQDQINSLFIDALILNPDRPALSRWNIFYYSKNDYRQLKARAEQLGHPNMQSLLATQLIRMELV